jgi:hypothetical protein
MRTGNKSGVLSANVGHEHLALFQKIFSHYNEANDYHYVPKFKVVQQMIENEHKRIFE